MDRSRLVIPTTRWLSEGYKGRKIGSRVAANGGQLTDMLKERMGEGYPMLCMTR